MGSLVALLVNTAWQAAVIAADVIATGAGVIGSVGT